MSIYQHTVPHSAQLPTLASIARFIGIVMLRLLITLVIVALIMPVGLLPVSTSTPLPIWALLAIVDFALLVILVRFVDTWRATIGTLIGFTIIAGLAVVASQMTATTPAIIDAAGKPLPGSIATLETVELNGSHQWISIRGKDVNKPVLLFLAGGPGGSQLATARHALGGLEDHFVVVNWEQPGAGKSFDAVKRSTLTPERYMIDAHDLILYLRQRFDEEKVYVLGESWGSALGIMLVQRHPDLFHAFIGTGQMVAFLETDQLCYDFALRLAQERGDTKKIEQLKRQGPPPYYGAGAAWKQTTYLLDTYAFMNQNPSIADNGFNTFRDLASPEYGLYDKVNWFRGVLDTLDQVYPQLWTVDFRKQAARLETPVYFLIGRHGINAPVTLTEQYYQMLDAPQKELIWFERSGHTPWVSEADRFVDVMVETVLVQTDATR